MAVAPAWEPDLRLLERAFDVLKHDWVWDFFFDKDASELDMLRHAVSKEGVATAELDITTMENGNAYESSFHVSEYHRLLLMPSYSTGSITVGFAVNERIRSSASIVSKEKYVGRIARDDAAGTCLFLSDTFSHDTTEMSFYTLISPSQREHIFSLFQTSVFRRLMRSFRAKFSLSAFRNAMIYFYYASEGRSCPTCGQDPKAAFPCQCKLALRPKLHSLDLQNELSNLAMYIGGYHGMASLGLFANGRSIFQANFPSNSCTRLTNDMSVHKRLAMFALVSAASKRSVDPLATRMGEGELDGSQAVSRIDSYLLASIAESSSPRTQRKSSFCGEPSDVVSCTASLFPTGDRASDACSPSELQASLRGSAGMSIPMLTSGHNGGDIRCYEGESSVACTSAAFSEPRTPCVMGDLSCQPHMTCEPSPHCAESPVLMSETRLPSGGGRTWSRETSLKAQVVRTKTPIRAVPLAPTPISSVGSRAKYILPLSADSRSGDVYGSSSGIYRSGEMDERQRKAELRKARNRESAQRSNEKRKIKIQALKDDIAAARTLEARLRLRESKLRQENLSLKTICGQ